MKSYCKIKIYSVLSRSMRHVKELLYIGCGMKNITNTEEIII